MTETKRKTLIYLAAPYSHADPAVRQERFERINAAASYLMRRGLRIFSPISHTHPIALAGGLPLGWDFWEGYDTEILSVCRAIVVLMLPGWDTSKGVHGEAQIAARLELTTRYTYDDERSLETVAEFMAAMGA
jgi:hypothetical protein